MKRRRLSRGVLALLMVAACVFTVACAGGGSGSGSYTTPLVSIQSTSNPLVAQVSVRSACSGQAMVQFGPDTNYGRTTAAFPVVGGFGANSPILVAGMRASTTYHMSVQVQCGSSTLQSSDTTFQTGVIPSLPLPTLTVTRPNPSTTSPENPGIELVDVIAPGTPALFTDRDANPIWYYDVGQGNYPFTFKLLPTGHVLLSISTASADSLLREVDLAGNTVREMDVIALGQKMQSAGFDFVPVAIHHDFAVLDNGHVIVLTNFQKSFTDLPGYPGTIAVTGDGLIDLDQNWNPVWAWNSFDYLDVNRHLNGLPDWTHSNAVLYSPEDGNILVSMRHQSWVLKINYSNGTGSGNIVWHLGYQGDFVLTDNNVPTTDPSEWFSFQHFPSIISESGPQTSLAIWDNGDNRVLNSSGQICGNSPVCYSRATVFQVDESAMVANLQWADVQPDYSLWGGSINQLENTNIEFDLNSPLYSPVPGLASEVQEVTQTSSPQVVWRMNVSPAANNAYRAYRVPSLYPGVNWSY